MYHVFDGIEVFLCFVLSSCLKAEAPSFRKYVWIFWEHLGTAGDDFICVPVVLHPGMNSADLEGDHYVLSLLIITLWKGTKKLVNFHMQTV